MSTFRRNTLRDVADYAGVSYQTVSRVINNHPYVAEDTRTRVLEAIQTLGYRPNRVAQSLAGGRSHTLAVITFGMDYYGPAQMIIHIEHATRDAGYDLIFSNISEARSENIRTAMERLGRWQVDGMILITPVPGIDYEHIAGWNADTPIVLMDAPLGSTTPSVVVDQGFGSRLVTQHLIDLGHQLLCEISGPLNWFGAVARHVSWLKTLQEAGLNPGKSIEGDWTAMGGYRAAQRLLAQGQPFTALVAGNDQMALGAIRALHEAGLRVPEDVSVVGFDDIPEASCFAPPLTTVRQDFDLLGKQGIDYLVQRIENPDIPAVQHVIYPQLLLRASTAPPGV
jgi:DNA-binding LacI/PurR family transcriptional regulator